MLKRTRIYAIIGIFIISFISHFVFELYPNILISIFFPVNESIWEHMKILFTSILIYSLIDKIILDKNEVKYNNFYLQTFITAIISIPLYLTIYLPIYHIFSENLIISIIILLIVYIIVEIISYYILKQKQYNIPNYIITILIILTYIIFTYLTYNPPHNYIFYDTQTESYGIKK